MDVGIVKELELNISPLGQNPRTVFIYLPSDYDNEKRYPVLYMFDGQNIFFDEYATYGKSWGMKDFLDKHTNKYIVVGIDCNHTGNQRLEEYTPFSFFDYEFGYVNSKGEITASWIVNKLKPYIDENYNTLPDRENTYIGGSSMGGLMSLYCISKYNHIFSKAACLAPSIMFGYNKIYRIINYSKMDKNTKVYMDFPSKELGSKKRTIKIISLMLKLNLLFQLKGVNSFPNVVEGDHNEATWEKTVPVFIKYFES